MRQNKEPKNRFIQYAQMIIHKCAKATNGRKTVFQQMQLDTHRQNEQKQLKGQYCVYTSYKNNSKMDQGLKYKT